MGAVRLETSYRLERYNTVNQALKHGIPLVTAGLTEDKADVNARVEWSGAGIDLKTNTPTAEAVAKAAAQFEVLSVHDKATLQHMIDYAQAGQCRWRAILAFCIWAKSWRM